MDQSLSLSRIARHIHDQFFCLSLAKWSPGLPDHPRAFLQIPSSTYSRHFQLDWRQGDLKVSAVSQCHFPSSTWCRGGCDFGLSSSKNIFSTDFRRPRWKIGYIFWEFQFWINSFKQLKPCSEKHPRMDLYEVFDSSLGQALMWDGLGIFYPRSKRYEFCIVGSLLASKTLAYRNRRVGYVLTAARSLCLSFSSFLEMCLFFRLYL